MAVVPPRPRGLPPKDVGGWLSSTPHSCPLGGAARFARRGVEVGIAVALEGDAGPGWRPLVDSVMRQPAGSNVAVAIEGRSEDRCYPTLFASNRPNCMPGYKRIVREGTGLVIVSVQHGVLSEAERKAIGQYRLQQYILANMYDPAAVERLGIT